MVMIGSDIEVCAIAVKHCHLDLTSASALQPNPGSLADKLFACR